MKVLVVDDSAVMRKIVIKALTEGGHTDVVEAGDGKDALSKIGDVDFILTDWNMPVMDGIDLLRAVRARGKDIPFVFITSEATEEMHALAYREGAAGVITKPITAEAVEAQLGSDYASKLTQKALLSK